MFTSDVHLCLTVGSTMVRRERVLRRHFGEKGLSLIGCLRTDFARYGETPDYISSCFIVLCKLYHGCRPYNIDTVPDRLYGK